MATRVVGLLLLFSVVRPASATAESQTFEIAMRMLCDSSNQVAASTENRSKELKKWVQSIIQNDEAQTLLSELAAATPAKRETLMRAAQAKVGLTACPVWDSLALQVMFSRFPAKAFHHQTVGLAMWMFCDAGRRFPATAPRRLASLESWIKSLMENPKALALFNSLLSQSVEEAVLNANKAIDAAGLKRCKLVESGDLAAMVNVHAQRREAKAQQAAQLEGARRAKEAARRAQEIRMTAFKASLNQAPKVTIKLIGVDVAKYTRDGSQWDVGTFDRAAGLRRAEKMKQAQKEAERAANVELEKSRREREACKRRVKAQHPNLPGMADHQCGSGTLEALAVGGASVYLATRVAKAIDQAGAAHVDVTGELEVQVKSLGHTWYTQKRKLPPIHNSNTPRWNYAALLDIPLVQGLKLFIDLDDHDGGADRQGIYRLSLPYDSIRNALQQSPKVVRIPFGLETQGVVKAVYIMVTAPKKIPPTVNLGELVVNLKEPTGDRFLKVEVELELDGETTQAMVKDQVSSIRYGLNLLLSGQRVVDVQGPTATEVLRKAMIRHANTRLKAGKVVNILIKQWIVQ